MNPFDLVLSDEKAMADIKDDPIHMAVLHALKNFIDMGYKLSDLPWFRFSADKAKG